MAEHKSFPHMSFEVKDESQREVYDPETLSLHVPVFLGPAQEGEPNQPFYGNATELSGFLGKGTFERGSKYFYHPNLFAEAMLRYQRGFFIRMCPDDANTASVVLECKVENNVQITQYEKDEDGARIMVDESYVPLENNGEPVKEPGVRVTWQVRPLADDEEIDTLDPVSSSSDETVYPIMALTDKSPTASGNNKGVKIWFNPDEASWDTITDPSVGTLLFRASFINKPYGIDTPMAIRDMFQQKEFEFSFKPGIIDPATDRRLGLDDIVLNNFNNNLPFEYHTYPENIETIGGTILSHGPIGDNTDNPWLVDMFSAVDKDGNLYDHVELADDSAQMDENVTHYMQGGSDGTITHEMLEEKVQAFLTGEVFPDITDDARYPITHIYDSGYTLDTKKAMIDFLGVRKDGIKVVLGTQVATEKANLGAEDVSIGNSLRGQLLLHPESTMFGTQVFRGTIFTQAGYLNESSWKQIVPTTYDSLIKRCIYQGQFSYKGAPKGLPRSSVDVFRNINWFPNNDKIKQTLWDASLNFMQYYDRTSFHYPDVRSVYPAGNSVLSDDTFADKIVYLYHICRKVWARFSGVDTNLSLLAGDIEEEIISDVYDRFGNELNITPTVYQTDIDKAYGYQSTIEVSVRGNIPQRVFNFIIPVDREETTG